MNEKFLQSTSSHWWREGTKKKKMLLWFLPYLGYNFIFVSSSLPASLFHLRSLSITWMNQHMKDSLSLPLSFLFGREREKVGRRERRREWRQGLRTGGKKCIKKRLVKMQVLKLDASEGCSFFSVTFLTTSLSLSPFFFLLDTRTRSFFLIE